MRTPAEELITTEGVGAHPRLGVGAELLHKLEHMPRRLTAGPHVLQVEPVELLQVGREGGTVLVFQLAELLDSPTALEYRLRRAENTS